MHPGPLYLIGPSGHPNFGDEFIAAAWLRHLAEVRPDDEVWLDCPNPGSAQILFQDLHPGAHFTNTVWRLVHDHAGLPVDEAAVRIQALVTDLGTPTYDLGLLKLRDAESIHLLGGGYINETWRHHTGLIDAMKATKALTGVPLFATGQGLLPALTGSGAAADLFHDFDHATARDHPGAAAYGIRYAPDDAFLGMPEAISSGGESDGLYICIQSDTVDPSRVAPAIEIARREALLAVGEGREVYYLEAVPGGDRAAFEQLADLIPERNFLPFATIWRDGLPLSPRQTWVTSRFHFHLLGAAAGGTGIAIGMNPGYYDVKHESVTALGSGWALAFDDAAPSMPSRAGQLAGKLEDLIGQKKAEAHELYPASPTTNPLPAPRSLMNQIGRTIRKTRVR